VPQEVTCDECGEILYKEAELKAPDEIIQKHNGKCPKCGRKLSYTPIKVEVEAAEG
jgi:predicted  nucleic acid-binding Zn-ribbon protein